MPERSQASEAAPWKRSVASLLRTFGAATRRIFEQCGIELEIMKENQALGCLGLPHTGGLRLRLGWLHPEAVLR
eukprot:5994845-Alexandrium_andersonii.AAC.1